MTNKDGLFKGQPLGSTGIWSPEYAEVKDGQLWWHASSNPNDMPDFWVVGQPLDLGKMLSYFRRHGPYPRPSRTLLDRFLRVSQPKDILRFTKDFGPLQLCSSGEPMNAWHHSGLGLTCMPEGWPHSPWHEDIEHWLKYVQAAEGVLKAAAMLRSDKRVPNPVWDGINWIFSVSHHHLPEGVSIHKGNLAKKKVETQREYVSMAINCWLSMVDIGMRLDWPGTGPEVTFLSGTSASLILQIIFAVAGSKGTAVCGGCGLIYLRKGRKPQTGRRNFCPTCREKGVGAMLNKRDQRAAT